MNAAKAFLHYLRLFEQTLCFLAFMLMAASLMGDVLKREFTGSGWFGAPQVGVVGMIVVAYMGIALASANGSHFRPKFADPLLKRWDSLANRIGEFGFAIFCYFMAYIAYQVALESYELDDVSAVLRWPIWPIQGVIVMGFFFVGVRHTLYGIFLELRPVPPESVEGIEVATDEEAKGIVDGEADYEREDPPMSGLLLAVILIVLLILRMNIIVILGVATFWAYYFWGGGELMNVVYDMWDASNREVLLSIPLYIMAGTIMSQGSIAERLILLMRALTKPIPGGLAIAGLLSCGVFAAISGSSAVTLLAVGSIMYPALIAEGYSRPFSIGMLCAGGTLGIIIPPSIPLILYGVMTQKSIADLFLAGTGPAALILIVLSTYAMLVNWQRRGDMWVGSEIVSAFRGAIFALMTPVVILGGIYSGYFTPTESASVAVLTALVVEVFAHKGGFINLITGRFRELGQTCKEAGILVWKVVGDTSTLMGSLFPILAIALSLNVFMTYEQVPGRIVEAMTSFIDSKLLFLLMTNILLLAVGLFLDIGSAILILSPLLPPMAADYGMDMIHFGIMMIVNLEIGYLTPPMGLNVIIAMGAFREDFITICKGVIPFILLMILCLIVVMFVPWLSLFLIT